MDKMLKNKLIMQLMRFAIVGGSAFLIDYGVMIFLTELFRMDYLISVESHLPFPLFTIIF